MSDTFPRAQVAISDIRVRAHAAGLTAKEFDDAILPHLDSLVRMKVRTPSQEGNDAGYDVIFTIEESLLDSLLLPPYQPIDTGTAEVIRARIRKHRESLPKGDRRLPYFVVDQIITDLIAGKR